MLCEAGYKHLISNRLRIFLIAFFALGTLYFTACVSLLYFIRYRHQQVRITLSEILLLPLPRHWARYEAKHGKALIRESLSLLRTGNLKSGAHALKVGLAKAPDDTDGLLLYAQLQMELKRPDLAEKILTGGLAHLPDDLSYAKTVLAFLLAHQKDQAAYTLCTKILNRQTAPPELTQFAALSAATACYYRGCYDQAQGILKRHQQLTQRNGILLDTKILWELGYRELALYQLRNLIQTSPSDEELYQQFITYLREDARTTEARQASLAFQLADPVSILPRIDLLRNSLSNPSTPWGNEADTVIRDFASNPQALLALAEMAATSGQPELVQRIRIRLSESNSEPEAAVLLAIEAMVVAKDYRGALAAADEFSKQSPTPAAHFLNVCAGLQAIACFGDNDPEAGRLALHRFLTGSSLHSNNLLLVANRLIEVGARQPARETLTRATSIDPLNQAALKRLIEIDLEDDNTDALPANVRRLVTMRKPSRDILRQAQHQLGGDRLLFSRETGVALRSLSAYLSTEQPADLVASTN